MKFEKENESRDYIPPSNLYPEERPLETISDSEILEEIKESVQLMKGIK